MIFNIQRLSEKLIPTLTHVSLCYQGGEWSTLSDSSTVLSPMRAGERDGGQAASLEERGQDTDHLSVIPSASEPEVTEDTDNILDSDLKYVI